MSEKSSQPSKKAKSGNPGPSRDSLVLTVDGQDFHLGYSRISQYLECPRKYKFSYIDRLPAKPGVAMARGTAYHNTLEALLKWKIRKGKLTSLELARKAAIYYSEGESLSASETERVIQAVDFYWRELYGDHRPLEVEIPFEIVRGGIKLTGRIDLVEDTGWIIDHKFSYDTWAETRAKYGCQPIIYQWAGIDILEKQYPTWSYSGFAYNIIRLFPTPVIQEIKIARVSQSESDWWEEQLSHLAHGIRNGVFYAHPGDKTCQYCPYKEVCQPTIYSVKQRIIGKRNDDEEDI